MIQLHFRRHGNQQVIDSLAMWKSISRYKQKAFVITKKKGNQDWTSKIAAIHSKTFKRISFCCFIILNLLLFKYLAFCTHFLKMVCVENRWLISEGYSSLGSSNDAYFSLFTVYFIDFIFFSC